MRVDMRSKQDRITMFVAVPLFLAGATLMVAFLGFWPTLGTLLMIAAWNVAND